MLWIPPVFVSTAGDSDWIESFANTPTFSLRYRFAKMGFSVRNVFFYVFLYVFLSVLVINLSINGLQCSGADPIIGICGLGLAVARQKSGHFQNVKKMKKYDDRHRTTECTDYGGDDYGSSIHGVLLALVD